MATTGTEDVNKNISYAAIGLNMDDSPSQVKKGEVTYACNAVLESIDGNSTSYQNETGNQKVTEYPQNSTVIGKRSLIELNKAIVMLYSTVKHEIGYIDLKTHTYKTLISGDCLNFDIDHPIHKIEYEINGDAVRIYWADNYNPDRYLDINRLSFKTVVNGCEVTTTDELDCNKLRVQPLFSIPYISDYDVISGGDLTEGSYQFGVQYSDAIGTQSTSVYNISNPISVFKEYLSQDFNLPTGKAISLDISNLDTERYTHYNLIVVKTINNIPSFELVGTYPTTKNSIVYTGESKTDIRLSADDILQRFPIYERSKGVTQADNILIWSGVTEAKRVNYQSIASKIKLQWVKYKIPKYLIDQDPSIIEKYRGYMGGEVYAFEFQPILKTGKTTDGFHIPCRNATPSDREVVHNPLADNPTICSSDESNVEKWRIENTYTTKWEQEENITPEQDAEKQQIKDKIDQLEARISSQNLQIRTYYQSTISLRSDIISAAQESSSGVNGYHSIANNLGSEKENQLYSLIGENPIDTTAIHSLLDQFVGHHGTGSIAHRIYDMVDAINASYEQIEVISTSLAENQKKLSLLYGEYNSLLLSIGECDAQIVAYGEMGYYESEATYPCNKDIWGELAGQPITHHRMPERFPDDAEGNVYIIGVRVDLESVKNAITQSTLSKEEKEAIVGFKILRANRVNHKSVIAKGIIKNMGIYTRNGETYFYPNYPYNDTRPDPFISITQTQDDSGENKALQLDGFFSPESKKTFTFHSPDTSFYQPFLGDYIKIEGIKVGTSKGHFTQVKEHPRYQIPSRAAYATAIAITIGIISAGSKEGIGFGGLDILGGSKTDWQEAISVMLTTIDLITKAIPYKNLAYQFNSVGEYTSYKSIPKGTQSIIPLSQNSRYLSDGLADVRDIYRVNNFLRETSVYLKTTKEIPFTHDLYPEIQDTSRWVLSNNNCKLSERKDTISAYYVSLRRFLRSQYGDIYSYETVDTGYYYDLVNEVSSTEDVFGGDIFISKFSFKTKHSFFDQNLVGRADNLSMDFRNHGNVGYPTYWISNERDGDLTWGDAYQEASAILTGAVAGGLGSMSIGGALRGALAGAILGGLGVLLDNQQNNFDCRGKKFFYQDGKFYLFSYGIPYFYTETEINLNYRQSYNNKEGDFYPNTTNIDDWLQEINVPIVNDNSYFYNKTFSKQNKENYISHLPEDYDPNEQVTHTNRAVYSEKQSSQVNYKVNNWLIYRPLSYFDFPQNMGKLISLDEVGNRVILARFENGSELYNTLLKIDTSNPQAAYIGSSSLFNSAPPIDFSNADTGYMGSQHQFLLKTPFGALSVDAKRGQIFLISGQEAIPLSTKITKFLSRNLPFQAENIQGVNIDNAFNGIGITGTYDDNLKRAIITKRDFKPITSDIIYKNGQFVHNNKQIDLSNTEYFEDRSFTLSIDLRYRRAISFHTYIPKYYIQTSNLFYSGADSLWIHKPNAITFNNFFGVISPYILEYPFSYRYNDEILQSIQDYTNVYMYTDPEDPENFIEVDEYFDEAILYSNQQSSGVLKLHPKPKGNMKEYMKYPIYDTDSKTINYTKTNNFYQYNTFWSLVKDLKKPLFIKGPNLSIDKVPNNDNLDYSKRFYKKEPIMAKDLKVRHTLNTKDQYRLVSQFILTQTQQSHR